MRPRASYRKLGFKRPDVHTFKQKLMLTGYLPPAMLLAVLVFALIYFTTVTTPLRMGKQSAGKAAGLTQGPTADEADQRLEPRPAKSRPCTSHF